MANDVREQESSPRRSGLISWIAWLTFGLLALMLWNGRGERDGRRSGRRRRAPSPDPSPEERLAASVVPDGASFAWVPAVAGGVRICERNPDGREALVFIHGLGGRLEHWSAQLDALGPALRGVSFDLPGHGESDWSAATGMVDACAGALAAVADALALRRVVLVAHSFGALVALRYAARHAGRVSGILLVDPSGDATHLPAADRSKLLEAARQDPRGELGWQFRQLLLEARPEVAERVLADLESTGDEVLLAALEATLEHSPLPDLERLVLPVRSVFTAANHSPHSLHRLDPDLPASPVHGTGHWPMLDDPETVNLLLDSFLDEVRAHQRASGAPG